MLSIPKRKKTGQNIIKTHWKIKSKPEVRPPKTSRTSCIKIRNEFSYLLQSAYIPTKEKLLVQWSSNTSVHQTSLKGLFRHRSLGTNSRAYDWIGLCRTQRFLEFLRNTLVRPEHIFRMYPQRGTQTWHTQLREGGHHEVLSEYTEHFHVFPLLAKHYWS